jgi:hypothetical protein
MCAVLLSCAAATMTVSVPKTAHAQDTAPKKKPKKKPADAAPAAATPAPAETPPPAPAPTPAPAADTAAATTPAPEAASTTAQSADKGDSWDSTDVFEKPGQTYYFVGLRYRGTVIPKFILNMFVDEGATIYSNSLAIEADIRKDGFSLIPSLMYVEYGTGDILFKEKSKDPTANNYSVVNSSLKALYLGTDLLWSAKLAKNWDFEYGAGVGIGAIFGDLGNSWVYADPNGPLVASTGAHFSKCPAPAPNPPPGQPIDVNNGCIPNSHTNPDPAKTGSYTEKSWANGGSKPNAFIHLALPLLGLRYKPLKQLETRIQIGMTLTGFTFGISGDYGFERPSDKPEEKK